MLCSKTKWKESAGGGLAERGPPTSRARLVKTTAVISSHEAVFFSGLKEVDPSGLPGH